MVDALMVELEREGMVQMYVRVRPGMPTTALHSVLDDGSIKIDIAAPPMGGKANEELIRFLADIFGGTVEIVSGKTARMKLVRITR